MYLRESSSSLQITNLQCGWTPSTSGSLVINVYNGQNFIFKWKDWWQIVALEIDEEMAKADDRGLEAVVEACCFPVVCPPFLYVDLFLY